MRDTLSNVIYDVGLFNGDDTAYYLFQGYKVVAIDANPLMIEGAKKRFAKEIEAERLTLLNVGISNVPGTATFWISDQLEWSSFDRAIASRTGVKHRPVPISVVQFSQILAKHGNPYYLKIDIEGNDRFCVEALDRSKLPVYISVESECVGSKILSAEENLAMLELLHEVGYRKFKLVSQLNFNAVRSTTYRRLLMRLVNSASRGRLRVKALANIAERFSDQRRIEALGFSFSSCSSGPWGEDIPGDWMSVATARSVYSNERRSHFAQHGRPSHSFWYDWHAKH